MVAVVKIVAVVQGQKQSLSNRPLVVSHPLGCPTPHTPRSGCTTPGIRTCPSTAAGKVSSIAPAQNVACYWNVCGKPRFGQTKFIFVESTFISLAGIFPENIY